MDDALEMDVVIWYNFTGDSFCILRFHPAFQDKLFCGFIMLLSGVCFHFQGKYFLQ